MGIRARLILIFTCLAGFGFYYLTNWIVEDLRPQYARAVEDVLVDSANVLAEILGAQSKDGRFDLEKFRESFTRVYERQFEARIFERTKTSVDVRVYVTDKFGRVLFDSSGQDEGLDYSAWQDVARTLRGEYGARTSHDARFHPTDSVMHVAAPIFEADKIVGVVAIAKPTTGINAFLSAARPEIQIAGIVAGLSVIILGLVTSLWVTAPIHKLSAYAKSVRDGRRADLPALGSGEMAELGKSFAEMTEALAGKNYVENYVQALTHELKSPIAAIQGAAELLNENMAEADRRRFAENIRAETGRMKTLVDRMLELSALEGRKHPLEAEVVLVGEIVQRLIQRIETELKLRKITVVNDVPDTAVIVGEAFLIEQALLNVLQNAVDFSGGGDVIRISSRSEFGKIEIIIEDEGTGVPEYAIDRLFEKFYSLPRPETGLKSTGLGLSFVKEIMERHGGTVRVKNRANKGAVVTLSLPAAHKSL